VAVTIATIVNWLANFIVGLVFPYIFVSCVPAKKCVGVVYTRVFLNRHLI